MSLVVSLPAGDQICGNFALFVRENVFLSHLKTPNFSSDRDLEVVAPRVIFTRYTRPQDIIKPWREISRLPESEALLMRHMVFVSLPK